MKYLTSAKTLIFYGVSFCLLFNGCGGRPYDLVPAEGVITINGTPAANIMVRALPDSTQDSSGPSSSGITNEKGEFKLVTDNQELGAVPGDHIFTFFDMDEERPQQGEPLTKPPRINSALSTTRGGIKYKIEADKLIEINLE